MPNFLSLRDLVRALDALGADTSITSSRTSQILEALEAAILAECAELVGSVPATPAIAPTEAPKAPAAGSPKPSAPAEAVMEFGEYLSRFMAAANANPTLVKDVLKKFGLDRGANARAEDRAAIIAAVESGNA